MVCWDALNLACALLGALCGEVKNKSCCLGASHLLDRSHVMDHSFGAIGQMNEISDCYDDHDPMPLHKGCNILVVASH